MLSSSCCGRRRSPASMSRPSRVDSALAADPRGIVLKVIGANTAITAVGVIASGILPQLAASARLERRAGQTHDLHDPFALEAVLVSLLVQRFQIARSSRNSIHEDQVVPPHSRRRVGHDLRGDDQVCRAAFKPQAKSQVKTGCQRVDVGVVGQRQEETDRFGFQLPVKIQTSPRSMAVLLVPLV